MDAKFELNLQETVSKLLSECTFTQEQLSFYFGVDRTLISKWKNGSRVMNSEQFEKLCDLVGCSMIDIIEGKKTTPLSISYRGVVSDDDLFQIAKVNKLVSNIKMMEELSK